MRGVGIEWRHGLLKLRVGDPSTVAPAAAHEGEPTHRPLRPLRGSEAPRVRPLAFAPRLDKRCPLEVV